MNIRKMDFADWNKVTEIYQKGIDNRLATFETKVPSWEEWDNSCLHLGRNVLEYEQSVIGWTALKPISSRACYQGAVEISIYLDSTVLQKGLGSLLMQQLIEECEDSGIWSLHSSIFPENLPSIGLHEKFGFRKVGIFQKIGKLDGIWRDTILFQRNLEKNQ